MTRSETIAFNAGVSAVLDLAKRSADGLAPKITQKPTRFNFAIEALDALAEEGRGLLITLRAPDGQVDTSMPPAQTRLSIAAPRDATPRMNAAEKRSLSRMKGYTGEACGDCGNFTLVRNGTCLKCETCGATTGCS